jgi:hypothetical protein
LSFFDEDDEPRTRVRPRRPATSRAGASPDRQTVLIRQVVLFGGLILVVIILFLLVRGCRNTAAENAMKDYNRAVGSLVSDSDTQVGKPFFDLLRNPGTGDIRNQVAGFKAQADQQYQQAKRISTPGEMTAAQRSFLIAMEMRRDGLQSIADRISTALSSDAEAADKAITEIAGAMEMFLASDVVYTTRTELLLDHPGAARRRRDRRPADPAHRVPPWRAMARSQHRRRRARPAAVRRGRRGRGRA